MTRATLLQTAATLAALGPINLLRVGCYRIGLKFGRHPVQKLRAKPVQGPFFKVAHPAPPNAIARTGWAQTGLLFGWKMFALNGTPDWHENPFRPGVRAPSDRPWWKIPDFNPATGDIKAIWEMSRFDWVIPMAQRAALGDETELARLNDWLNDWSAANPPYMGANWKCGQEASIRVMHLAVAASLLGQTDAPLPALRALIRLHLRRIAPTTGYAMGQQNNHGTSEAAALFIGGSWLEGLGEPDAAAWHRAGVRWLEDRARVLIADDGTFSQYSVNYHRLMLATYSFAEVWRRRMRATPFSQLLMQRLDAATTWLFQLTQPETGDAPNLGANDGAHLIVLTDASYRDHRPVVQLAAALFQECTAYPIDSKTLDQTLLWLGVTPPQRQIEHSSSHSLDDGGLHVLRRGELTAYFRYPRYRFRPSQSDALHLDLWRNGQNILRDAGSYSYNISPEDIEYFSGVAGHNTAQIDDRDQMPRIGRFLFGGWLRADRVELVNCEGNSVQAAAAYRDAWGARHYRRVQLTSDALICEDEIGGTASRAVLRWRLAPSDWSLVGAVVSNGEISLHVETYGRPCRLTLVEGQEAPFYLDKSHLQVLEVEITTPCRITTRIVF